MITDQASQPQDIRPFLNYVVGHRDQYAIISIDDRFLFIKDGAPHLPIFVIHVSRDLTDFSNGISLSMS